MAGLADHPWISDEEARQKVANTYQTMLGRAPDEGGLAVQMRALESDPNFNLTNSIRGSDEFKAYQPTFDANRQKWANDQVSNLYKTDLGRDVDAGSRDAQVQRVLSGGQYYGAGDPNDITHSTGGLNADLRNSQEAQGWQNQISTPGITSAPPNASMQSVMNVPSGQNYGGLSWYGAPQNQSPWSMFMQQPRPGSQYGSAPNAGLPGMPSMPFNPQQGQMGSNYQPGLDPGLNQPQGQKQQPFGGFVGQQQSDQRNAMQAQMQSGTQAQVNYGQNMNPAGFYNSPSQQTASIASGIAGASSPTFGTNSVFASGQPYSAFGGV